MAIFSYTISTPSRTSAGVYKNDGVDDILVQTLWSGKEQSAGTYNEFWDGRDDEGELVADGEYKIKVLTNNVTYEWEGTVGNNSEFEFGIEKHHAKQPITNMALVGDFMYYAIGYREGKSVHPKFHIDSPRIVRTTLVGDGQVIRYLATDGVRVYNAGQGGADNFVSALTPNPAGIDSIYVFSAGVSHTFTGSAFTYSAIAKELGHISGLAVQVEGNYLFVPRRDKNELKVYNKVSGEFVRTVSLSLVREIRLQDDNTLWLITSTNTVSKHTVNEDGTLSAATLILSGLTDPLALAITNDGTNIAVADRATYDQVKIFNTSTGSLIRTIGREESYSNPTVYDDKFYFSNTRLFIETDEGQGHCYLYYQPDGSIWIGDYGNMRSQHFTGEGVYIDNIQYQGFSYSVQADINNPTRVFSHYLEFEVDYSKPLEPNNGSWTFVRNWSKNITGPTKGNLYNRLRSVITLSNGRTYSIYNIQPSGSPVLEVLELDPVSGIRFTGVTLDNFNAEIFSDGSQWQIGVNAVNQPTFWKRRPLTGFDGNNNPVWGAQETISTIDNITENDPVTAGGYIRRDHLTDSNVIATYSSDNGQGSMGRGYHLGGVKNNKWLFKTSPSTHREYAGEFPDDGAFDIGNGVQYAGTYMQVVDRNIFWGYSGEFWKNMQTNKYNHYYDNGLFLGQFGVSGDVALRGSTINPFPGYAGNPLTGTYIKNGDDIFLYHADESLHAGIHRWKISDLDSIDEEVIIITKSGTPVAPELGYINLMEGLPFNQTLPESVNGWSRNLFPDYDLAFNNKLIINTSKTTYKDDERDITLVNYPLTNNKTVWVKRDLGTNNLSTWSITGEIAYLEESQSGNDWLDVLDVNDRVIARIERKDTFPTINMRGNGTNIVSGTKLQYGLMFSNLQPFSLSAEDDIVTVIYKDFTPVVTTVFDPLADITQPKTLRLETFSSDTRGHRVSIANLRMFTESTVIVDPEITTPEPPTIAANDTTNTLSASHILGSSEILVSENDGSYTDYLGQINVGNTSRAVGYWKFKIKASTNRNESSVVSSPAFTETQVNQSPVVSITSPLNNTNFTTNTPVTITTNATDSDGTITKVEFFSGETKIGEDVISPFTITHLFDNVGSYQLTAKATDNLGATTTSNQIQVNITAPVNNLCTGSGTIIWEYWKMRGGDILSIPTSKTPDTTRVLKSFSAPVDFSKNYGARIRALLCVSQTGNYTFYIAADDVAELWLSTDSTPENKELIAYVESATEIGNYFRNPSQISEPILLQEGQQYYIETLMIQKRGIDHLSVACKLPNCIMEVPIAGSRLSPFTT